MGYSPSGRRRSWEYPNCPECGSDVLVEARTGDTVRGYDRYYCWGCEHGFNTDD